MRTIFIGIYYFLISNILYAQGGFNGRGYGNLNPFFVNTPNYDGIQVETKGSRFFNSDDWAKGELQSPDSLYKELLYRYDQIAKTLQIKFTDGKEFLLDPRDIVYFKLFIEDKTILFERTLIPYRKEHEILQVIYSSPTMRLLRDTKKKKTRINETDPYTSAPTSRIDVYENDYRYYLVFDDMTRFHSVQISKAFFANLIPHKASFINNLFSRKEFRNDLTVSKLKDLMQLLDIEMQRKDQ